MHACKILNWERIFTIQMAIESWEWDQHKSTIKYNLQNELGVFVASCHDYLSDTIIQEVRVIDHKIESLRFTFLIQSFLTYNSNNSSLFQLLN